jgi:hypothetical protein
MVIDASADYVIRQIVMSASKLRIFRTRRSFSKGSSINSDEDGDDDNENI